MAIYLKIRIIYVALVDMGTLADAIVFKSVRFQMSTLIRYVCVSICIHFQQRFQIDAFSVNTLSVFERISVDGRPKRINLYAFSNENALVWTGPKYHGEKRRRWIQACHRSDGFVCTNYSYICSLHFCPTTEYPDPTSAVLSTEHVYTLYVIV